MLIACMNARICQYLRFSRGIIAIELILTLHSILPFMVLALEACVSPIECANLRVVISETLEH